MWVFCSTDSRRLVARDGIFDLPRRQVDSACGPGSTVWLAISRPVTSLSVDAELGAVQPGREEDTLGLVPHSRSMDRVFDEWRVDVAMATPPSDIVWQGTLESVRDVSSRVVARQS